MFINISQVSPKKIRHFISLTGDAVESKPAGFPTVKLVAYGQTAKSAEAFFFFQTTSCKTTEEGYSAEIFCCLSSDLALSGGKVCSCQLCIYIVINLFGESDFKKNPKFLELL